MVYEELLAEAAGCDLETLFRTKDWGLPLVHAEADYARPLRLGDRVRVRATIARQGERSLTFEYELTDATSGEPRAKAKLVHACASLPSFAGRALPADLLDGLRRMGLLPA